MTAPALTAFVQGQGSTSADNLNTFVQSCDNFAQIRALTGLPGMQIWARGQSFINDGYQGAFYWNAASLGPDDNINIIVPLGSTLGAWVRLGIAPTSITPVNNVNYQAVPTDRLIVYTGLSVTRTVTLPEANTFLAGVGLDIRDFYGLVTSAINITVAAKADNTLDGVSAGTVSIVTAYSDYTFYSDGVTSWSYKTNTGVVLTTPTITSPNITTPNITGVNDGSNAAIGAVGEFLSTNISAAGALVMTTVSPANIALLTLSAGDWDMWGCTVTTPAAGSVLTSIISQITNISGSLVSPAAPNGGAYVAMNTTFASGAVTAVNVGPIRTSISTTTTFYLTAQFAFTSTLSAYGFIGARRRR